MQRLVGDVFAADPEADISLVRPSDTGKAVRFFGRSCLKNHAARKTRQSSRDQRRLWFGLCIPSRALLHLLSGGLAGLAKAKKRRELAVAGDPNTVPICASSFLYHGSLLSSDG